MCSQSVLLLSFFSQNSPLDSENRLSLIESLDLLLPFSALKQSNVFPIPSFSFPPLTISKWWSSYQHHPPDLASPLQCDGGLISSFLGWSWPLNSKSAPHQVPRSVTHIAVVFSIQLPLMCPHFFSLKRRGIYSVPFRRSRKSHIKSKMNNRVTMRSVITFKDLPLESSFPL